MIGSFPKYYSVSGKTGEGVEDLLEAIVETIPSPSAAAAGDNASALIFDFGYSNHKGIILHVRVFEGTLKLRSKLTLVQANEQFSALDVGVFKPQEVSTGELSAGDIGYVVTGIKEPGIATVGDTVASGPNAKSALEGYARPLPVVWASIYPESQDDFDELRQSLEKLRLSDSSLVFEEESSRVLGRGFRCGFLGMLHLEIIVERIKREFKLTLIVTSPSITYEIEDKKGDTKTVYSPVQFPEHGQVVKIREPWVDATIIMPDSYMSPVMALLYAHEALIGNTEAFGDGRISLSVALPLREMMRGFFDTLKSVTSGYASVSYVPKGLEDADVVRLEVLVAEEPVAAFTRVVSRRRVDQEARKLVEKLHEILPKQLFTTKIQGKAMGRIISSKTLKAMRKDVTGHLYGGDITRKKKLLEKQKKGKKKLKAGGTVNIPHEVFIKMIKE